ncbi:Homocysteine S-methyltransferase 1 [Modicella reniformis]|uniref:Homocysteine S-methyltransferase 1 n=1 Tax=Modicella reniformis TaxID=1440133 RepID=A0A9P6MAK0_9FUNG|nr:Homocysteine S-methyltransferase 1 [Modicella reniformis]
MDTAHQNAELLIPLGLLSFTILAGIYRYFFVLRVRSYYSPLPSQVTGEDGSEHTRVIKTSRLGMTIAALNHIVVFSFVASLAVICLRVMIDRIWSGTLLVMYNLISFVAVSANMLLMHVEVHNGGQWSWANYGFWWLVLAGESYIGWFHLEGIPTKDSSPGSDKYDMALVGIFTIRYALLWTMALLSVVHCKREPKEDELDADTPETISVPSFSTRPGTYGTFAKAFLSSEGRGGNSDSAITTHPMMGSSSDAEIKQKLRTEQEERATAFKDFWPKIKSLIPLVYPKNDAWLHFLIFLTLVFLLLGRVVNLLVPILTDRVVSRLYTDHPFDMWGILLYVFVSYLQGGSGLLSGLRGWAWIPIEQYSNSTLTIQFFEHIQNLSLQFHLNRKTGELLRILDRGSSSIVSLMSTVLFQLFPVVADVLIAVVYFLVKWDWRYSVIVFVTIVSYVVVTVVMTEWRTQFRRAMISFDNDARAKAVDSLLNFETVKYYTAEEFETNRYREAIEKYMVADYKSQFTYQVLNLVQSFVITLGMLAGCLLCAYDISIGKREPANFVTFIVYLKQLYAPLNWFGSYYRMLQQNFIDMEKMVKLLNQNQSVKDVPGAERLVVREGEVVFENVSFQYDSRQRGLENVSFTVPKGKTVALVGPTGSGKSTILRLLFRFYDVSSGRILIDGQDISQRTQTSLREQIGVVPQDAVLFNDSIYFNINYGRSNASKDEVEMAAKAAQIHDKIMDFPEQYNTMVGERGLRLSGGEKQRVAIARTILKNPPIVLLDEATSALDSVTESHIQTALARMTENRTTLVVAHRLSTVVNADLILCIKDGVIVEQGTHDELIEKALANGGEGVYYGMWKQQSREEQGDEEGVLSDDSDTKKKQKGKRHKEPRAPQQPEEHRVAVAVERPATATPTAATVQENLPVESPTDPREVTQIVVEPSGSAADTTTMGSDKGKN